MGMRMLREVSDLLQSGTFPWEGEAARLRPSQSVQPLQAVCAIQLCRRLALPDFQ
jgi:hypothetical protein